MFAKEMLKQSLPLLIVCGIGRMIPEVAEASLASRKRGNADKTDVFAKRIVRDTSPERSGQKRLR